jgi:hypothetical protein
MYTDHRPHIALINCIFEREINRDQVKRQASINIIINIMDLEF